MVSGSPVSERSGAVSSRLDSRWEGRRRSHPCCVSETDSSLEYIQDRFLYHRLQRLSFPDLKNKCRKAGFSFDPVYS